MPHQDTTCPTPTTPNHQDLKAVCDALLRHADFHGIAFRDLCTWTPSSLIVAALLWVWSDEPTLTKRFTQARKIAIRTLGLTWPIAATYQAFLKMLRRWTGGLAVVVVLALRQRLQQELPERYTISGYVIFGVDGSRLELPRTRSNQDQFAPKAKSKAKAPRTAATQKKIDSPQMWLTLMFHVSSGLPWDYRFGPSDSSEREHLQQMIGDLPGEALVTADAGFVGYECWKALIDNGRELLIRVGANVRLLRQLGYVREHDGIVDLWPSRQMARRQPPLVLRLVVAHTGRHPVYLVTSVLDKSRLSATQVIAIYRLQWSEETAFAELEATLDGEINTLGYRKAALLAFCVALVSYNVLSTVKAALRAVHGEEVVAKEVSAYYVAEEITMTHRGMRIAIPEDEWVVFQELTVVELADVLVELAKAVRLPAYRKHPHGPKKPKPKKQSGAKIKHVATAKVLANRQKCTN